MSGLQNVWRSGLYAGGHAVQLGDSIVGAVAIGMQPLKAAPPRAYVENSPFDTHGTPFVATTSAPLGAALVGITCGPGNAVSNSSQILFIDGHQANQSLTGKYLYGGNCPIATMAVPSSLNTYFYVYG